MTSTKEKSPAQLMRAQLRYVADLYSKFCSAAEQENEAVQGIGRRALISTQIRIVIDQAEVAGDGASARPLRDLLKALDELQDGRTDSIFHAFDPPGTDDADRSNVLELCRARRAAISSRYRL